MFINVSIEIPRMFSLVMGARSRNKVGWSAKRLACWLVELQQASPRKTIRKRKRARIFSSSNRDRDASCGNQPVWGGSCGHCTMDSHVLVARELFFQFIIHYFDVIRPGASSLNSWYHSVDFSSPQIIRFG